MFQRGLTRHVRRNHTDHPVFDCSQCGRSFARHGNLEKHRRNCTDGAPAGKRQRVPAAVPVAVPEFVLRETHISLGGAVKQFTVNVIAVSNLSSLKTAMTVFKPSMLTFQQRHHSYKFQFTVDIMFHKADDPAVVTQPPVTLTSEMLAVYSDSPSPRDDVYRQLHRGLRA